VDFETLRVRQEGAVLFADIAAPPMNLLGTELVRDLVSLIQRAEPDSVIEGTWEYEIAGKSVKAKAGDVLFIPAGTIHSAKNVGTGPAELATCVVAKGQPLLTLIVK
jgi:hypothetical protein